MKEKPNQLIYLAAPYSHSSAYVIQERLLKVTHTAAHAIEQGYLIYSPLTHSHPILQISDKLNGAWRTWAKLNQEMLRRCDRLLVLTLYGWEKSVGVQAEIDFWQKELGKQVEYIDYDSFEVTPLPR